MFKSLRKFFFSIFCDFSLEDGGTLLQNSYKPSPGPMRSYPVKENPIGSDRSFGTNNHTNIPLLYYKDNTQSNKGNTKTVFLTTTREIFLNTYLKVKITRSQVKISGVI